ncbi:DUF3775 domain-containing protein [Fluviicoccus keumensis]|nr:DUF3775 domain-containing protein [Fluviicoccus keumensis]
MSLLLSDVSAVCRLADEKERHGPPVVPDAHDILPLFIDHEQFDRQMVARLSPAGIALLRYLQRLQPSAVAELAALAWFGRGDAPIDQLRHHAESSYHPSLSYYLAEMPSLGDHLRAALARLPL